MKTLILLLLLILSGCSGHNFALIYQYDSEQEVKIETKQKEKLVNNIGVG